MKVGDKVFCKEDVWIDLNKNCLYIIENITSVSIVINGVYRNRSHFKLAMKNNKLNKKLYPDYNVCYADDRYLIKDNHD